MIAPAHRVDTTYEDTRHLITGIASTASIGEHADDTLTAYTYQNDALGRRARISITGVATDEAFDPTWTEVAYNAKSEVTGTTDYRGAIPTTPQAPDPGSFLRRQTYQFDSIGNREKATRQIADQPEETTTYDANALNLYTSISETGGAEPEARSQQPTADESGNLLEDSRFTYTWDGNNRLIAAESKDGTNRVEHRYDHQGRRIRSVYLTKGDAKWQPTEIKTFLYDDWSVAAEFTRVAEDTEIELLTWGRDLSGSLQGAGGVGGLLAISEVSSGSPAGAENRFFHYDANGNVVAVANDVGSIEAQYRNDGFGREITSAGSLAHVGDVTGVVGDAINGAAAIGGIWSKTISIAATGVSAANAMNSNIESSVRSEQEMILGAVSISQTGNNNDLVGFTVLGVKNVVRANYRVGQGYRGSSGQILDPYNDFPETMRGSNLNEGYWDENIHADMSFSEWNSLNAEHGGGNVFIGRFTISIEEIFYIDKADLPVPSPEPVDQPETNFEEGDFFGG